MRRVPTNLHTFRTRRYWEALYPWGSPFLSLVGVHTALRITAPLTSTDGHAG